MSSAAKDKSEIAKRRSIQAFRLRKEGLTYRRIGEIIASQEGRPSPLSPSRSRQLSIKGCRVLEKAERATPMPALEVGDMLVMWNRQEEIRGVVDGILVLMNCGSSTYRLFPIEEVEDWFRNGSLRVDKSGRGGKVYPQEIAP